MAIGNKISCVVGRSDFGCCDKIDMIGLERLTHWGKCSAIASIFNQDDNWAFASSARLGREIEQHCMKHGDDIRSTRKSLRLPQSGSTVTQDALAPRATAHSCQHAVIE